eukprot:RCo050272
MAPDDDSGGSGDVSRPPGRQPASYPLFCPAMVRLLIDGPEVASRRAPHPLLVQWGRQGTGALPGSPRSRYRPHADHVVLRAPRARPLWTREVENDGPCPVPHAGEMPPRVASSVKSGAEALRHEMRSKFGPWIAGRLSTMNMVPSFEDAEISEDLVARFMAHCEDVAGHGVYPRLVFHGTKEANLASIQSRGLLTPRQLHPKGWYTPAIWTATDPTTSTCYSDHSAIFACIVLDDVGARDKRVTSEERQGSPPKVVVKPAKNTKRQWGRHQHRRTRRPSKASTSTSPVFPPPAQNVERLSDAVVLVHNPLHVCPLLTIRYRRDPAGAALLRLPPELPRANANR